MIKIRGANPKDAHEFLIFLDKLDTETSFMLYESGERKTNEENMKRRIAETNKNSLLLIGKNDEKIIGKKLFEELDKWAIEQGIVRLELTVMINNVKAINLYKEMGFNVEAIKEKSCLVDGVFVDEYYMAKLLN